MAWAPFLLLYFGVSCAGLTLNVTQELQSSLLFPPAEYGNYTHNLLSTVTKKNFGPYCSLPLEIVIVQDATSGNNALFDLFAFNQSRELNDLLRKQHPQARVGVWAFRDKPTHPYGDYGDYCHTLLSPLYPLNTENVMNAYTYLHAGGGSDFPENQLAAMIAAIQSANLGWSTNSIKLVFLVTDSYPHHADDGAYNSSSLIATGFSGSIDWRNQDAQCDHEYYPSFNQTYEVFRINEAYFGALITAPPVSAATVLSAWQWFSNFLGQGTAYVAGYDAASPNLAQQIMKVVSEIENHQCGPSISVPP